MKERPCFISYPKAINRKVAVKSLREFRDPLSASPTWAEWNGRLLGVSPIGCYDDRFYEMNAPLRLGTGDGGSLRAERQAVGVRFDIDPSHEAPIA